MDLGPKLHDRATRGETLSSQERESLEAWYQEQDDNEMQLLGIASTGSTDQLRADIDQLLAKIIETTTAIQTISSENADLRAEVSELRQQLLQKAPRVA